jgi:hypothetical protein
MPEFTPTVDASAEFLEISNDFTDSKEILREGISNAFDAGANHIRISAFVDKTSGVDELVVKIEDDGHGMDERGLQAFFGLGLSTRRDRDALGSKVTAVIGEKGHGTKVYFHSRRIEVTTVHGGERIDAHMDEPRKKLRSGQLPTANYSISQSTEPTGTRVTVLGYYDNNVAAFAHDELKDYIYWFTKFGSPEVEFGQNAYKNRLLYLSGLGWKESEPDVLGFGHPFPPENIDIRSLKTKDKVSPLEYYVAKWVFPNEPVVGRPNSTIDMIFLIEGDQAKRVYNKMIHEKYTAWRDGQYRVEDRYGMWLCKDFIPITRKNGWVAERSEWTKYHAFVNSQDFRLTANRTALDNTPPAVLEAIETTVRNIFETRIVPSAKYEKYQEELEQQELYESAAQEEKDFTRRRDATFRKKATKLDDHVLFEPRQEGGVFSLFLQIMTLRPALFDFTIVDYDTGLGYDLLVTKDYQLDLNRAALRFVEMKFELKRDFNHSFKRLAAIVCWDTNLANDEEVHDLSGAKRKLKITALKKDETDSYTKYMLVADDEAVNIEVFVLRDFLKERLGLEFRPRGKE